MIEIKNLEIGYHNKILLKDTSSIFPDAQLTALIGRNGTGKSTLMRALAGINKNYKGEIILDKENLRNLNNTTLAKKIAFVNTQRPRMSNLKCREVVALGRSPYTGWNGRLSAYDKEMVEKAIVKVGMKDYLDRNLNSLSDGESQKIMIARAIAQDTPLLLLDEPTSFLDLPTRHELVSFLRQLAEEDRKSIIFSTHELDLALKLSHNIALLHNQSLTNLPVSSMGTSSHLSSAFGPIIF